MCVFNMQFFNILYVSMEFQENVFYDGCSKKLFFIFSYKTMILKIENSSFVKLVQSFCWLFVLCFLFVISW